MRQYSAKVPAAPKGVARRQLKANWGQKSCYVDLGLNAETVEFEAGPGAIAQVLHYSEKDELSRGERVPLVALDPKPKAPRRKPDPEEDDAPDDSVAVDLNRLNREKLLALADERKIATTGQESKKQLIALLSPPAPETDAAS